MKKKSIIVKFYFGNFWKHLGNFLNLASGHTADVKQILE